MPSFIIFTLFDMHLMYVDESGDPGHARLNSRHFALSGLIINQSDWLNFLNKLKTFRKFVKTEYNLNQRTEIHASELIRIKSIDEYRLIRKTERINILKAYMTAIPQIFSTAKVINVCIDKSEHLSTNIFDLAWHRLLQRYDTYLKKDARDQGIVIVDDTQTVQLMHLLRKMRVYNPTPSHFGKSYNSATDNIIEDTFSRSSHHSYFIQSVDVIVHSLYRKEYPKGSLKKFRLEKEFLKLGPILLKKASRSDPHGIVRK